MSRKETVCFAELSVGKMGAWAAGKDGVSAEEKKISPEEWGFGHEMFW